MVDDDILEAIEEDIVTAPRSSRVLRAAERAGNLLHHAEVDRATERALGELLERAAQHPSADVRAAVAHALQFAPSFGRGLVQLVTDRVPRVYEAARRALRPLRWRSPLLREARDEGLRRELAAIEATYGPEALQTVERAAEAIARVQGHLIAHEMRGRLSKVILALQALARVETVDAMREGALANAARTEGALRTLNALLTLTGAHDEGRSPCLLAELLRDAVAQVRADRVGLGSGAFEMDVPSELVVYGCGSLLEDAFAALLANAVESYEGTGRAVRVVVQVREDKGALFVEVRDFGAGMEGALRPHVFRVCFSTKRGAAGLGLAVAHAVIVDGHRGELRLDSALGEGTVVRARLPMEKSA